MVSDQSYALTLATVCLVVALALGGPLQLRMAACFSALLQLAGWGQSLGMKQREAFFDLFGAITYLILISTGLCLSGAGVAGSDLRQRLATGMVCVWAVRLGWHLVRRIRREDWRDHRFDGARRWPSKLAVFWVVQGMWCFMTPLAVLALQQSPVVADLNLGWRLSDILGVLLYGLGLIIEVLADGQKKDFRQRTSNRSQFINEGLWRYSRHPNYVGEMILWSGVWLFCLPGQKNVSYACCSVLAPAFVYALLLCISTPMLEERADAQWGAQSDYQEYKRLTPKLIGIPRQLWAQSESASSKKEH